MNRTAAGLAAYGRNGDSTLVHMSPGEVSGLQAFAKANGTTLTVNPHTGLHEAFNLKSLLPAAAGIGLTALSGGTLSPLMAGLIVGGVHGVATGFENPLQSAMAGLGGAGGAGLGGAMGLGSAAATPAATAAGTAVTPAAESLATNAVAEGAASQASSPWMSGYDVPSMETPIATQSAAPVVEAGRPAGLMDQMRIGATQPGAMSSKNALMLSAAPAATGMMEQEQMGTTKPISTIRPYSFNREVTPGAFDDLTDSRERRYFNDQFTAGEPYQLAKGGLATFARGGKAKKFDPLEQRYEMADFRDPQSMQKKTMGMYQYAAGQTVRGPGDGMSDEVKANIDGVQEARLSDGEFVIPADVVSGLGNGSTEAGSKHLKDMMARVRKSRTGKTRQAPQIKVKGLMPA